MGLDRLISRTGVVCIGRCWAAAPKTNESCLQTTTSISKPSLGFKPQGNITFYAIGLLIFCYLNYLWLLSFIYFFN